MTKPTARADACVLAGVPPSRVDGNAGRETRWLTDTRRARAFTIAADGRVIGAGRPSADASARAAVAEPRGRNGRLVPSGKHRAGPWSAAAASHGLGSSLAKESVSSRADAVQSLDGVGVAGAAASRPRASDCLESHLRRLATTRAAFAAQVRPDRADAPSIRVLACMFTRSPTFGPRLAKRCVSHAHPVQWVEI